MKLTALREILLYVNTPDCREKKRRCTGKESYEKEEATISHGVFCLGGACEVERYWEKNLFLTTAVLGSISPNGRYAVGFAIE